MTIAGFNTDLEATGTATAMSQEAMSVVAGTSNEFWTIDDATKDIFDWEDTLTVEASEDGGTNYNTLSGGEYTLRYLVGAVRLDNYTSGSGTVGNVTNVRVSGDYLPKYTALKARAFDPELTREELPDDHYTKPARVREIGLRDFTASFQTSAVEEHRLDHDAGTPSEDTWEDLFGSGRPLVISYDPDGTGGLLVRAVVRVFGLSEDAPVDDLSTKTLSFSCATQDSVMTSQDTVSVDLLIT